ncbi:cutinase [Stachybotrys elegans]|uniref:Cutinase n=1 Tax=Stachybotrys elegans TaxID=80388 RepID=A0A8K0SPH6_9HYPO|nr:cutinase [Stachybotrys elegans]
MKAATVIAALAATAAGAPTDVETRPVQARQVQTVYNELENGSSGDCPGSILVYARGSTEQGNIGQTVGAALVSGLRSRVPSLWIQGVGGPYAATLADNYLERGTTPEAIAEAVRLINLAHTKCPDSAIITGGYSQGAALIAAAISDLSPDLRDKVKASVLFGYTQNVQNNGGIPNFPQCRTAVYCNVGDVICEGILEIRPPHLQYNAIASGPAAEFLASLI